MRDVDPQTEVAYTHVDSPLGTVWIGATDRGLVQVSTNGDEETFRDELGASLGLIPVYAPEALEEYAVRFRDYFAGKRTSFDLPLDLRGTTPFQRAVLEAVAAIPYGEVRSYGEIAYAVGHPRAARAVGTVMATSPMSLVIPCHRVIRSDGTAGQYARGSMSPEGVMRKLWLLSLEGVTLTQP